MNCDKKKQISLFGLIQLAMIILCNSGVEYHNQVGGNFCLQKFDEGILTVIFDFTGKILEEIAEYSKNKYWLSADDADEIDKILWKYKATRMLSTDRTRLDDSCEAWIYVNIANKDELIKELEEKGDDIYPNYEFLGFNETKGILTWDNSD